MSIRHVLSALVALTMLLAPFAIQSGGAMAAMPSTQHAQAADPGHCPSQPDHGQPASGADHSCCAAMCSGVAVPPAERAAIIAPASLTNSPGADRFGPSHVARLPTPPPRSA